MSISMESISNKQKAFLKDYVFPTSSQVSFTLL